MKAALSGFFRGEQLDKVLSCERRGRRILSGKKAAIHDRKRLPIGALLEDGSEAHQLILDKKRDDMSEVHLFLFTIGKTRNAFSFHQRRTLVGHVTKHAGRMADQRDRLAGVVEGLEQSDGNRALCEVPHRTVPAHIEHRVVILRFNVGQFHCLGKCFLRRWVLLKPSHGGSLTFWQIALRVDGWLPTIWRGEGQLYPGIAENEVRGREFFEPEAGFAARVAKGIVGCEHH